MPKSNNYNNTQNNQLHHYITFYAYVETNDISTYTLHNDYM